MSDLALDVRAGLPDDLKLLLARYPRATWQGHVNLGEMARFWLSRHAMFRELGAMLDESGRAFRAGRTGTDAFVQFFVPRLQFFLQQLHAHHHVEDDHYFPIFRRAEARLARGFDILDRDHDAIAAGLAENANAANDLLRALDGPQAAREGAADAYLQAGGRLLRGLMRHLDDEEDLIVPLILDRGEEALGVAQFGVAQ
jgi:hemerythrin-like domain-containing protein